MLKLNCGFGLTEKAPTSRRRWGFCSGSEVNWAHGLLPGQRQRRVLRRPRPPAASLKRYRKRGPARWTRQLLSAIEGASVPAGSTLLDVGGGVGAIHHRASRSMASRARRRSTHRAPISPLRPRRSSVSATHGRVDLQARRLSHPRRGAPAGRRRRTLDRVVCCDPDFDDHAQSGRRRTRFVSSRFTLPASPLDRAGCRRRRNSVRALLRPNVPRVRPSPAAMAAVLERNGLRRRWAGGTFVWAAEVFER